MDRWVSEGLREEAEALIGELAHSLHEAVAGADDVAAADALQARVAVAHRVAVLAPARRARVDHGTEAHALFVAGHDQLHAVAAGRVEVGARLAADPVAPPSCV